jgi:UDP-2,3-diacylglucosamine pyrophosphatase LpxH
LCWLGDVGYDLMLWVSKALNWCRKTVGMKHWSLSKAMKHNVKKAVNYVSDFEKCLTAYATERSHTGVICGHIHTAALTETKGFLYANTGDWVESCTAIYEDTTAQLRLYSHHDH